MAVEAAVAPVTVPPQVLAKPGVAATTRPEGNVSLTARPVRETVLPAGFVIVSVRTELTLTATLVGLKAFVIVGGFSTANVAVAVVPVPEVVELTAPVVLVATPEVELSRCP